MSIHEDQKMPDITGNRFQRPASHTFSHAGYGKYIESDKAECLRASGGDIGGGSENLVLLGIKSGPYVRQIINGFNRSR